MKQLSVFKMIKYILVTSIFTLFLMKKSEAQMTVDMGAGVMSGYNNLIVGSELVSTQPFIIYKDIKKPVKNISPAATVRVGFLERNVNFTVGYTVGLNDIQPAFFQFNLGYQIGALDMDDDLRNRSLAVMPYVGFGVRVRNIEQGDVGNTFVAGVQLQYWMRYHHVLKNGEEDGRWAVTLDNAYAYKHYMVTIGIRHVLFENN